MKKASVASLSPLDGRYAQAAGSVRDLLCEEALIVQRCRVEIEWLRTLLAQEPIGSKFGRVPTAKLAAIERLPAATIAKDVRRIEKRTRHDVKAVEVWLAGQLKSAGQQRLVPLLHFGLTSWDVNNLAYALMLSQARDQALVVIADRLVGILDQLAEKFATAALLGRTHAQPASPTTMGKEMAVFAHRLKRQRDAIAGHVFDGKCNGAVGNYNALVAAWPRLNWPLITRKMIEGIGLRFASHTTQIEPYDGMVEFFDAVSRANRVLRDLAQDASVYIGAGHLRLPARPREVGSSTMPHKINPIDFENGEGNIAVANALLTMFAEQLQQSRLQRDLSDSTILRNIGTAFGHTVVAWTSIERGLQSLDCDRENMAAELDANWQVLAEAAQTVLRRMGNADAYEIFRKATRSAGRLDHAAYCKLIREVFPNGSPEQKMLLALTPEKYIGLAARLAGKKAG